MQDAFRTHTEAGFRVDRDSVTGKLSISEVVYGQSGTEVTLPFNGNTVAWFHTHPNTPDPSSFDRKNARGESDPFKGTPLYGHKSVSYVTKVPGSLRLYNGANPTDAKGKDRVIDAPTCPP